MTAQTERATAYYTTESGKISGPPPRRPSRPNYKLNGAIVDVPPIIPMKTHNTQKQTQLTAPTGDYYDIVDTNAITLEQKHNFANNFTMPPIFHWYDFEVQCDSCLLTVFETVNIWTKNPSRVFVRLGFDRNFSNLVVSLQAKDHSVSLNWKICDSPHTVREIVMHINNHHHYNHNHTHHHRTHFYHFNPNHHSDKILKILVNNFAQKLTDKKYKAVRIENEDIIGRADIYIVSIEDPLFFF